MLKKIGLPVVGVVKKGVSLAQDGIQHCEETKEMLKENQTRVQQATAAYAEAVNRCVFIIEKMWEILPICERYGYDAQQLHLPTVDAVKGLLPSCELTQDKAFLYQGAAAGAAAASSTLGGAALLGTASTGAAISGLHGAAAVGATLASLGGGSIAAGGLGIVGGAAVLGSTFAIPAVAVGGYLWDKTIRDHHEKVVAYEKAVEGECAVLRQAYVRYNDTYKELILWLAAKQENMLVPTSKNE